MSRINAPRGTADTLPAESWKWQAVEAIAREVATLYHFAEIRTPVYEFSELFHRGVGENTDIVSKETFTFNDRGGESITLRPEGTAGVVRAAIENNLIAQEGSRAKLFYIGPNFRYDARRRAACASTISLAWKHSALPSRNRMSNASSFSSISIDGAGSGISICRSTVLETRRANSGIEKRW